ncbi:hemerythrin domain-containing protein [Roseateles oligotrophus]|uniref:Hemerythrin domain-containing protein n=1 Tax=Roseateles oligotrophus TaxID=1769250 RepID=A0ABT2YK73_9BURK|nr:hemerythrin domain-containing protein [Roseateles oligotrophus]MCV2370366.1 hemerythrin domain-containing protein [Roseateles oligotrophus]
MISKPLTIKVIQDEHGALSAMLHSVPLLLAKWRGRAAPPEAADFAVLRAMLFYVDEFPEKLHHPKETELLFPKLRARAPEIRDLLDKLDEDHLRGERAIRDLERALLAFEMMGEPRRAVFEQMTERYVHAYLHHMQTEEREILPLALKVLKPDDWSDLDEAFAANRDPLTGHTPDEQYRALFEKVRAALPAPVLPQQAGS